MASRALPRRRRLEGSGAGDCWAPECRSLAALGMTAGMWRKGKSASGDEAATRETHPLQKINCKGWATPGGFIGRIEN
jgi:hypothetical protein